MKSMAEKRKVVWFQLVNSGGAALTPVTSVEMKNETVANFLVAAHDKLKVSRAIPSNFTASDLKVFGNCEEYRKCMHKCLKVSATLNGLGASATNALVVEVPRVWFKLVDYQGTALTTADTVPLTELNSVEHLRNAVFNKWRSIINTHVGVPSELVVYSNDIVHVDERYRKALRPSTELASLGKARNTALIVKVPQPSTSFGRELTKVTFSLWENVVPSKDWREMQLFELYQRQGYFIRNECQLFCEKILDVIDEYNRKFIKTLKSLPFICVFDRQSQLPFALDGRRPFFYMFALERGAQSIHKSFASISSALGRCVNKDDPAQYSEVDVVNTKSGVYQRGELWTFGFIRALLDFSSSEEIQQARKMIRFEEWTTLYVEKCKLHSVHSAVNKMKKEGKLLPFFVLDEMVISDCGRAVFQRNAFRVCGLVVVVIGAYEARRFGTSMCTQLPTFQSTSASSRNGDVVSQQPRSPPVPYIAFPVTSIAVKNGKKKRELHC